MAQIIRITSEALQATIRRLLPSQQGFGEDLQASNVIQPIIDLTPSAEGSETRQDLQTAFSFGSITSYEARNSTETIANTPGFYRVLAGIGIVSDDNDRVSAEINITNGLATKKLIDVTCNVSTTKLAMSESLDFTVFLKAGETLQAVSSEATVYIRGSSWQIADVNGNFNNPSGFTPQ